MKQRARNLRIVRQQAERLAAERMSDIGEGQRLVALAHPGDRRGDILCGPVRHRGLEAGQRFRLVVTGQRLRPAVAGAAVVVGQHCAAALGEIAGKAPVELAGDGGRRIDQDGVALGPAGQKQRRGKRISVGRGHRDVVDENVVQPRVGHRLLHLRFSWAAITKANSAFAARACRDYRKSNWRSARGLCITRPS